MPKLDELKGVDLNLLKALDALIVERNVTRAAARLGISQSAMSAALSRLRQLLGDELLTRATGGMRLTPRAMALADPLKALMEDVRALVGGDDAFDPGKARRRFTIALPDATEFRLIPTLLADIQKEAPGIELVTRPFDSQTFQSALETDHLDLAIGFDVTGQTHLIQRRLFGSEYVVLFSREQTGLTDPIDLSDYVRVPHVVTSYGFNAVGAVDEALAAIGRMRTIVVRTSRFLMLPLLVSHAPVLATVERNLATMFSRIYGLSTSPLPISIPSFSVNMVWHSSYTKDPGHAWLRRKLQKLASDKRNEGRES